MKKFLLALVLFLSATANTFAGPNGFSTNNVHRIRVINSGLAALEQILEMVERANRTIELEYYSYNADMAGRLLGQTLVKKAQSGVRVRILLDALISKDQVTPFTIHELEKYGIQVKYFNDSSLLKVAKAMYRNHRKMLIVDDQEVLTGGRNIGNEFFDMNENYNFTDRDLLIAGPIVREIKKTFDAAWNSSEVSTAERPARPDPSAEKYQARGETNFGERYGQDLANWEEGARKAKRFLTKDDDAEIERIRSTGKELLKQSYQGHCQNLSFITDLPMTSDENRKHRAIKSYLFEKIKNAKREILVETPYFVTDKESSEALLTALRKNIRIELLTNSLNSMDGVNVFGAFLPAAKGWLKNGLETSLFIGDKPDYYKASEQTSSKTIYGIHAKTYVFDNSDVVIGTYNFDPRSANYNVESIVTCDGNRELANSVSDDIRNRMQSSIKLASEQHVDAVAFHKARLTKVLGYFILKYPSMMLDFLL